MEIITEDFVSFETAKLLKEKNCPDFGYSCICDSEGNKAQTQSIIMKWLREKECVICVIPLTFYFGENVSSWGYNIWAGNNLEVDEENTPKFTTYEDAVEAAIKYCLEHLI